MTTGSTPAEVVYTPRQDFFGTDSIEFSVTDGIWTVVSSVTITVSAVNDAPVANPQTVTLSGGAASVTLSGSDIEGSALTYSLVSLPSHGTLTGDAPNLIYTPDGTFVGSDSFTFIVNDGTENSNPAIVSVVAGP